MTGGQSAFISVLFFCHLICGQSIDIDRDLDIDVDIGSSCTQTPLPWGGDTPAGTVYLPTVQMDILYLEAAAGENVNFARFSVAQKYTFASTSCFLVFIFKKRSVLVTLLTNLFVFWTHDKGSCSVSYNVDNKCIRNKWVLMR